MMRQSLGVLAMMLGFATAPEAMGQAPSAYKARLDAIVKAQEEAHQRYIQELDQKQGSATDHYLAAVTKNTDEVLDLVRAHPKDPANVQALAFVIKTARGAPGDESYQAMEILLRDHVRDPGMGVACERGFLFFYAVPASQCIPQERKLVARLKDKPFALVSVNTDATVETLKKSIASGAITWRCWYDGPLAGPITTRWGVWAPPTIFVLDKAGVIRFKDVRGADLDRAVANLLDEAHVEKPGPRAVDSRPGCVP